MAVNLTTDSLLFLQVAENERIILKYHTDEGGDKGMKFVPTYKKLSEDPRYKNIVFLTIDADDNPMAKKRIVEKQQPVITIYFKGRLMDSRHASTKEGVEELLETLLSKETPNEIKIINSDKLDWPNLFLENEFLVLNYQPEEDCAGCKEMNLLFQNLSNHRDYDHVKFLWVDSRNNPVAEEFIKKRQAPFIAVFKEGFLIECNNIQDEKGLKEMLNRLFTYKIKL